MNELVATYRLQLSAGFTLHDARRVAPYLRRLGISHLYLSPIWRARPGSTHGYDVIDPAAVSEELGGETALEALGREGLGIVVDVVPNHMAMSELNPYWSNPELRQRFFDVDQRTGFRRRFFDVDDLVGVRMEDPEVFEATHAKLRSLVARGLVEGIRVDHVDGLADPAHYLERLAGFGARHVWVEKILQPNERLRPWPVDGTTGYDFLNDATALFVDGTSETALTELTKVHQRFEELARSAKLEQASTTFAPEVRELRSLVEVAGVEEALASLPVYRSYVEAGTGELDPADAEILAHLPEQVRAALLSPGTPNEAFLTRFQQTSPAVMAKGVEDTAFYRYVRLLALNEVGGDPGRYSISVEDFHHATQTRIKRSPQSMLTSQTHDTKRSGDVRARLVALSWRAETWTHLVHDWHEIRRRVWRSNAPSWSEELLIYQTLLGAWPIDHERLDTYLRKSLREAKQNSNWLAPDLAWEDDVLAFSRALIEDERFRTTFDPFFTEICQLGEQITLGELALRLCGPGVPDVYQGDEDWCFSLVDPDNRRSVDWRSSEEVLERIGAARPTRREAKLFTTHELLALRRRRREGPESPYRPLPAPEHVCAFEHRGVAVAVAVRDADAELELPSGQWTRILRPLDDLYGRRIAVYERS